jgi:hypothetical protein
VNTIILGDKNPSEILPYSVDFTDRLLVGETISTPFLSILVFSGQDGDPDAMIISGPTVVGNTITFVLGGGNSGVIYLVVVSAGISDSNLYMKTGHLAVVASDPFATY